MILGTHAHRTAGTASFSDKRPVNCRANAPTAARALSYRVGRAKHACCGGGSSDAGRTQRGVLETKAQG